MKAVTELSNEELNKNLIELCSKERRIGIEILWYLIEVEERKLYYSEGFSSLFAFCTGKLKFSESQALRRVRGARLLKDYPELEPLLREGEIKLCSLAEFWGLITKENAGEVFALLKNKSRREAESLAASLRPQDKLKKESIKAIAVQRPNSYKLSPAPLLSSSTSPAEKSEPVVTFLTNSLHLRQGGSSVVESRYELRFSVKAETKSKLHKVQALLSGRYPKGLSLEETLDVLLSDYLERHSREAKAERAKKRAKKIQNKKQDLSMPGEESRAAIRSPQPGVGKSCTTKRKPIAEEVKRKVYERDGYCCTFKSVEGVQCKSNWDLEIDHIHPVAFGGGNDFENLRVLCRGHNAARAPGEAFRSGENFIFRDSIA